MKKTIFVGRINIIMAEEEIEYTEVETEEVQPKKESLKDALLNSDTAFGKSADFFERNKKIITGVSVGIVAIVLGGFFYSQYIYKPADLKSQEALWHGEYALLNEGNWDAAINGLPTGDKGLKSVSEEFSGYSGGEIAQYELGIAYLNNGQFQEAIDALEKVSFEDEMISTITLGAIGDANMELNKVTVAGDYYKLAYTNSKNNLTAPIYMLKAAYAKELENKFEDAVKIYQELIDKYPYTPEVNKAKKYIELAKKGKSIYNL